MVIILQSKVTQGSIPVHAFFWGAKSHNSSVTKNVNRESHISRKPQKLSHLKETSKIVTSLNDHVMSHGGVTEIRIPPLLVQTE